MLHSSLHFECGSKRLQTAKTAICVASILSSNGRISSYYYNITLALSNMPILWCSFTPCGHNIKDIKGNFTDVITNELF